MARVQIKKESDQYPLTRPFSETVRECLQESADFRKSMLRGAVGCMLTGEIDLGRSMLRQYVNGTVGFIVLGKALGRSPKTLMQMLGPKGNPHIKNFFEIVAYLQKIEGPVFDWPEQDAA